MPSRDDIIKTLINILTQIQAMSGHDTPAPITPNLRPLCDLEGFESINAAEATAMLADTLHLQLNDIPFFPQKGKDYLTINQIADQIIEGQR